MKATEIYLLDISSLSSQPLKEAFEEIKEHFVFTQGKSPSERKESLAAKLLLHRVLTQKGLKAYKVFYPENEKPRLDGELSFNISHSGDFVALALSPYPVGCDIQQIRPYNPKVAKRNYCPEERAMIEAEENKDNAFIRLWALKESILKFTGEGISGGLDCFDFSPFSSESFSAFGCNFFVTQYENTYLALCHKAEEYKIIKTKF